MTCAWRGAQRKSPPDVDSCLRRCCSGTSLSCSGTSLAGRTLSTMQRKSSWSFEALQLRAPACSNLETYVPAPSGRVFRHMQAYLCACDACACTNIACADSCPAGSFRGGWHQCVPGKSRRCCHAHSRRAWYICQAPFPSGHAHLHRSHPRARVQRPPGAIALPLSISLVATYILGTKSLQTYAPSAC